MLHCILLVLLTTATVLVMSLLLLCQLTLWIILLVCLCGGGGGVCGGSVCFDCSCVCWLACRTWLWTWWSCCLKSSTCTAVTCGDWWIPWWVFSPLTSVSQWALFFLLSLSHRNDFCQWGFLNDLVREAFFSFFFCCEPVRWLFFLHPCCLLASSLFSVVSWWGFLLLVSWWVFLLLAGEFFHC